MSKIPSEQYVEVTRREIQEFALRMSSADKHGRAAAGAPMGFHVEAFHKEVIKEIERAIEQEPEFPGGMPDAMWEAIKGDRDACEAAFQGAARLTKQGIAKRLGLTP